MAEIRNTPTLDDLAERFRKHYRRSIKAYLEASETLLEARELAEHGEWLTFLETINIHARTAQRMLRLARSGLKYDMVSDLGGIAAALDYLKLVDDVAEAERTITSRNETIDELRERVAFNEELATRKDGAESAILNSQREIIRSQKARTNELLARIQEVEGENNGLRRRLREAA